MIYRVEGIFLGGLATVPWCSLSSLKLTGLETHALQPASRKRCCTVTIASAVTAIAGIRQSLGCRRSRSTQRVFIAKLDIKQDQVGLLVPKCAPRGLQIFRTQNFMALRFQPVTKQLGLSPTTRMRCFTLSRDTQGHHAPQLLDQRLLPRLPFVQQRFRMSGKIILLFLAQILTHQDEHGKVGRATAGTPLTEQFEAAGFGQDQIENRQFGQVSGYLGTGLGAIRSSRHCVPPVRRAAPQPGMDVRPDSIQ